MTDDTTTDHAATSAVATTEDEEARQARLRKAAILRAVGLESVPAEQRELALAIANRYDLDLMLKHLVLVEGRPYITRDALLWVAHRSGHFDGITATEPVIKQYPGIGDCWWSEATVWRDDMSHPFTYGGRYPVGASNKKYGPEMAIKVAECMTLRRAFNVSAASLEERWSEDAENAAMNATAATAPQSLGELVQAKAEAIQGEVPPPLEDAEDGQFTEDPTQGPVGVAAPTGGNTDSGVPTPTPPTNANVVTNAATTPVGYSSSDVDNRRKWDRNRPTAGVGLEEASEFSKAMNDAGAKITKDRAPATPTDTSAMVKDTKAESEFKTTEGGPDTAMCDSVSPYGEGSGCALVAGHKGVHRNGGDESWN